MLDRLSRATEFIAVEKNFITWQVKKNYNI